jgi:SH3-like domain-containing protein
MCKEIRHLKRVCDGCDGCDGWSRKPLLDGHLRIILGQKWLMDVDGC